MQVIIPPAIRRIMQAYPPVEPLTLTPPVPPPPPRPLNLVIVFVQIFAVFMVCGLILGLNRWLGGVLLIIGLAAIVIQVMVKLRQQLQPNRRKEEEYIQALAIYAQAEKAHQEKVSRERTPQKVLAYRQQQLDELRQKVDRVTFTPSNFPLPPWLHRLKEQRQGGSWWYLPNMVVPGLESTYTPQCLYENDNKTITIVIDYADTDQSFLRDFFAQRAVIWILAKPEELDFPQLSEELERIWAAVG
ncbi:MAG: hypothetical protein RMK91_05865 [Pseudanabaenaceae cyanobacterium SKYGB_i_bin29]|nr:hypothetical protein [Pseudanabaenaceae cyanobacterium SKYG29]MDW8421377.1 hypothetical protein [Pseudanabaenaceae cyanobacterium SKYGB_i_bin29]